MFVFTKIISFQLKCENSCRTSAVCAFLFAKWETVGTILYCYSYLFNLNKYFYSVTQEL